MHNNSARKVMKTLLLIVFSAASIFVVAAKYGVDSYSIYLNEKLLLQNALDKPLSLTSLKLTEANAADYLLVRYRECHAPASGPKGRAISLRNDQGKIVKEWKFKNDGENNGAMKIPVREVLDAQKQSTETLVMFYSSDGLGRGQQLAAL